MKDARALIHSLAAADLPRSSWYYPQTQKGDYEEIAPEHPECGLSRIMAELREVHDCAVKHKVVERLLRLSDLHTIRGTRQRRPGGIRNAIPEVGDTAPLVPRMDRTRSLQVFYTEVTEESHANGRRKAVLMPIIGHTRKPAVSWAVGKTGTTEVAFRARRRARETVGSFGIPY